MHIVGVAEHHHALSVGEFPLLPAPMASQSLAVAHELLARHWSARDRDSTDNATFMINDNFILYF